MKTSWLVWTLIIGIFITVLVAFNHKGDDDVVPLSEIFAEEEVYPVDIEYEFVEKEEGELVSEAKELVSKEVSSPAMEKEEVAPIVKSELKKAPKKKVVIKKEVSVSKPYAVQIASFRKRDKALAKKNEVGLHGFSSYIVSRNLGEKGIWYRVYVGDFATKRAAHIMLNKVKGFYGDSFIISTK